MNGESRPVASGAAPKTPTKKSDHSVRPASDSGRVATTLTALDPEWAYIGALLWLPADSAARELVEPEDLADLRLRAVLGLIRDVAAGGAAPDPVVVMARARAAGTVTTTHATKALAELVADLYGGCPLAGSVGHYAGAVLDGSLRRRCVLAGERIGQVGESGSLAELVRVVGAEVAAVCELRNRRAAVLADLGMPVEELAS